MRASAIEVLIDPALRSDTETPDVDQRVYLHLDWDGFLDFLRLKGDAPIPRITYLDGVLELMSPSTVYEGNKTTLGRLLEHYAWLVRVRINGYGSWTLKTKRKKGGVEPDECYVRDGVAEKRPDLAIEVVHTSGGLSKLEVYARLRVPEVWYWVDGELRAFGLRESAYQLIAQSEVLPEVDLSLLAACMHEAQRTEQADALEFLEAELRRRGQVRR